MSGKHSLQRTMLYTLIVALVLTGLVGIWVFVFGSFGETEFRILATTLTVSFFSVTALGCAVAQQLRRSRWLWVPGLLVSAIGFVVFLFGIWGDWINKDMAGKSMAILALFAFSFGQACLLSLAQLSAGARWVFYMALLSIFALATLVSGMIIVETNEEWFFRLAGVLGIIDGCASLAIPLLYKLGYREVTIPMPPEVGAGRIKLQCPRCGHEGEYSLGVILCSQCSLKLRVEIVEESTFPEGTAEGPRQFRLRTLLIVTLIASLFFGWAGARLQQLRRQQAAIDRLEKAGAQFSLYGNEVTSIQYTASSSETDLAGIDCMRKLRSLSLRGEITNDHLRELQGMTQIGELELGTDHVTDAGMPYVGSLTGLWSLRLDCPRVTDAGLAHLAKLSNLRILELQDVAMTDAGLVPLQQLSSLESLSLVSRRLTEQGVARLRKALPQAKVLWIPIESVDEAAKGK